MRKFVIKKRQKRRYTKKSQEISSFSFSKTMYEMMPLLVMLIAFMSTIIISSPVRNAFTNIRFTFELPQFSFTNPLSFIQTFTKETGSISILILTMFQSFGGTIGQNLLVIGEKIPYGIFSIVNFFELCFYGMQAAGLLVFQKTLGGIYLLEQFLTFVSLTYANIINTGNIIAIHFIVTTVLILFGIIQLIVYQIAVVLNTIIHTVVYISLIVINSIVFVTKIILTTLMSIVELIGSFIAQIAFSIIHVIEIPFKIVDAFWLLIKPYVDIFGRHVRMSGGDFSNMFNSFYRVASLMTPQK